MRIDGTSLLPTFLLFSLLLTLPPQAPAQEGSQAGEEPQAQELSIVAEPQAGSFEGKVSDAQYPSRLAITAGEGNWMLKALGSGLRTKFRFKVYEGVLYADETSDLSGDPYNKVIHGPFARRIEMHFLRDVGAGKIRSAFADGFEKTVSEEQEESVRADKEAFLSYFDRDLEKGDRLVLTFLPDIGLQTLVVGEERPLIKNPALSEALVKIWLGDKPISGKLKKGMIRLLE